MADQSTSKSLMVKLGASQIHRGATDKINVYRNAGINYVQTLNLSFRRTVRVTDSNEENALPPSLGSFEIYRTNDYKDKLPEHMAGKQGYFIPMYQREAMWINMRSATPFAVKIYIGGVNAISGEPAHETELTMMRRLKLLQETKNIQDYLVTPKQLWLDGIASSDGTVRQFVPMPIGAGYSVEAQITGEEVIGGLQIEVIPSKVNLTAWSLHTAIGKPQNIPHFDITVKQLTGDEIPLGISAMYTVNEIKSMIAAVDGTPPDEQRLIYGGKQMEDHRTVGEYRLDHGATIHLVLRLRGGGGGPAPSDMGIALGGLIRQTILRDRYNPTIWEPDCGTIFNVQILNSARFRNVTGKEPPSTPITAKTYAKYGYPYFSIFDEKASGVQGDFHGIESVNEKDLKGPPNVEKVDAVDEVTKNTSNPVVLLDEKGQKIGFRPVSAMEKAVRERFGGLSI